MWFWRCGSRVPSSGMKKIMQFYSNIFIQLQTSEAQIQNMWSDLRPCAVCEVVTVGKPDKGILGNNIPEKKPSFLSLWLHGGCIDNKSRSERSIQLKTEGLSW